MAADAQAHQAQAAVATDSRGEDTKEAEMEIITIGVDRQEVDHRAEVVDVDPTVVE